MKEKIKVETITPLTHHRASFVASMGYKIELDKRGLDMYSDTFMVTEPKTGLSYRIKRKNFFRFISQRHNLAYSRNKLGLDAIKHT